MDDDFYSSGSSSSVGDATVEASPSHVQRIKHHLKPPDQLDTAPTPTDSSPVPLLRLSQVLNTNHHDIDIINWVAFICKYRFMIGDNIKVM